MKKLIFTSAIISILLILASCGGVKDSTKIENVSVSFSVPELSGGNARTIMPTNMEESDITKVTLYAEKYEGSTKKEYELSKSEWITLAAFEQENFTIAVGKYSFILNICANNGFSEAITQTCTLDDVIIDGSTKTISFDELKYANDYGYVLYNISWPKKDVIAKVEAALYQGTELKYSQALMRNGTDSGSTATATIRVNNGSYISKLMFYNNNDDTIPFNTITDVIKVNGYKTEYEISMALELLNIKYSVTFDPNGGKWKDGSTGTKTATRNAYDGFVSPAELEKQGWIFDGWLDEDGNSMDDLVTPGSEESARDWTVYANWVKKASGNITLDNGALTITAVASSATTGTLLDNGVLYQNDTITFTAKDNAGNDVTDDVEFEAKLLYKGQDIGDDYYTFSSENKNLKINGLTKEVPSQYCYQLYVTANWLNNQSFTNVYSSQTFDVRVESGLSTPVTQVALYRKSGNPDYFYFTDYDDVGTADLSGTADCSMNESRVAFDASGNIYISQPYSSIKTNNPNASSGQITLNKTNTNLDGYYPYFTIDVAKNVAYAYYVNEASLYLCKYPEIISAGSGNNPVVFGTLNTSYFVPNQIAINNDIVYCLGSYNFDGVDSSFYLVVYDISSGNNGNLSALATFDFSDYLTNSMGFSSSATVTEIFAMEGAAYILVYDKSDGISNGLGSVIKYVPPANTNGEATIKHIATKLNSKIQNTDINYMLLLDSSYDRSLMCTDEECKTYYKLSGNQKCLEYDNGELCNTIFPTVYSITSSEKYLAAPTKVIAIKPKKLIIADDGYAFYTDTAGELFYKNMNRVVTIDLQQFVVDSIQSTPAQFESDAEEFLKTDMKISTIASAGTYFDSMRTVYSIGSDNQPHGYYINPEQAYISIREGN